LVNLEEFDCLEKINNDLRLLLKLIE